MIKFKEIEMELCMMEIKAFLEERGTLLEEEYIDYWAEEDEVEFFSTC